MYSISNAVHVLDKKVARSTFGRVFRLEGSGHVCCSLSIGILDTTDDTQPKERKGSHFVTEVRAGLTTFFTMAYIIAVNVSTDSLLGLPVLTFLKASILSESGATCVCKNPSDPSCTEDLEYAKCLIGMNPSLRETSIANISRNQA